LFLAKAINALAEIDSGIALMNTLQKDLKGHLRIGTTPTLNMEFVPRCIALFTQDHQSMHVLVEEDTADELISGLRSQRLDLVLAYGPLAREDIVFEGLYTEEMILVVGARHAFANRRRVRVAELHRRELALPPRKF